MSSDYQHACSCLTRKNRTQYTVEAC
jgi:hypothetical protein